MSEFIFFNIWDGHFKMWGYDCYQNDDTGETRLITYWGKIQNTLQKLQQKEKIYPREQYFDCMDYIHKSIDDKLSKGYIRLENSIYTKYVCGEITLDKLIEEIEKKRPIVVSAG